MATSSCVGARLSANPDRNRRTSRSLLDSSHSARSTASGQCSGSGVNRWDRRVVLEHAVHQRLVIAQPLLTGYGALGQDQEPAQALRAHVHLLAQLSHCLAYAQTRDWSTVVPPAAVVGGVLGAVTVGATAGLWLAMRAARMSPTGALRSV